MNFTVEVPEKAKIQVSNENRYVYLTTEKHYDPKRKFNVDKRRCIGKLSDDDKLIPNETYFEMFPDQKHLMPAPDHSDTIKIGLHVLYEHILDTLDLGAVIDTVYQENAGIVKDVASYMITEETSAIQHFENYGFDHPVFSDHIYSDGRISELMHSMTMAKHDLFLEKWNLLHNETEGIYISYDSTNMNSAATGAKLLEYGYSKDKESPLPQINVSIGIDQTSLMPMLYELYPGSIIDNTQCQHMVNMVHKFGYRKIGFILDRGYFSEPNIHYFEDNHYDYIIMAIAGTDFVHPAVEETRLKLRDCSEYYMADYGVSGMTADYRYTINDGKCRLMHVFFNETRAAHERRIIKEKFAQYDKQLDMLVQAKTTLKKTANRYSSHYHLKYLGEYLTGYTRNKEKIDAELQDCGYFVIITSQDMTAEEALKTYRHRDTSEKLFLADKTFLGADTIRVHSDESIESKTLINFIALIIRNEIYKQTRVLYNKSKKDFTIPAIIRELDKIIITRDSKGKYSLRYALTKTQKDILGQFHITEKSFTKKAGELCEQYSSAK